MMNLHTIPGKGKNKKLTPSLSLKKRGEAYKNILLLLTCFPQSSNPLIRYLVGLGKTGWHVGI
jgi:hypothetical protein